MPAEIYNTNPTVFATKAPRPNHNNVKSLWIDEPDGSGIDGDEEDEPIDSDEIFGSSISHFQTHHMIESEFRTHTFDIRSRTSIDVGTVGSGFGAANRGER